MIFFFIFNLFSLKILNLCYVVLQSFGSQQWDTGFAIQALLATNLTDEIRPTLARGYDFIKKSQVHQFLGLMKSLSRFELLI